MRQGHEIDAVYCRHVRDILARAMGLMSSTRAAAPADAAWVTPITTTSAARIEDVQASTGWSLERYAFTQLALSR